ncbi:hypothetical protein N431DRAFT_434681 [Stipitochalara longipes BDJ]|nr:hypothetical protein N431DRAFT_434681 [Stipitochalara longipes BDJ]
MFEYGAPLVQAWAQDHRCEFEQATHGFRELMGWITNRADTRWKVIANLCGLSRLEGRFQRLKTAYHMILEHMPLQTPLKQALLHIHHPTSELCAFANNLRNDTGYELFRTTSNLQPTEKAALFNFLRSQLRQTVKNEAFQAHLTQLIPMRSRATPGLWLADISLSAPVQDQDMIMQYRKGVFMDRFRCVCDAAVEFRRGHEDECPELGYSIQLSRGEQRGKKDMRLELGLAGTKFTNIDFFLNMGQVQRVALILRAIQRRLFEIQDQVDLEIELDSNA